MTSRNQLPFARCFLSGNSWKETCSWYTELKGPSIKIRRLLLFYCRFMVFIWMCKALDMTIYTLAAWCGMVPLATRLQKEC